jgi:hypothetical protein
MRNNPESDATAICFFVISPTLCLNAGLNKETCLHRRAFDWLEYLRHLLDCPVA